MNEQTQPLNNIMSGYLFLVLGVQCILIMNTPDRYLVLDEADRMLAAEGGDWVGHVQRAISDHQARQENQLLLRPPLQRLLFSATLSSDPEQLQHVTLHHPKLFTVGAAAAGEAWLCMDSHSPSCTSVVLVAAGVDAAFVILCLPLPWFAIFVQVNNNFVTTEHKPHFLYDANE